MISKVDCVPLHTRAYSEKVTQNSLKIGSFIKEMIFSNKFNVDGYMYIFVSFAIFTMGNNSDDFLFVSLGNKTLPIRGLLLKERI